MCFFRECLTMANTASLKKGREKIYSCVDSERTTSNKSISYTKLRLDCEKFIKSHYSHSLSLAYDNM